MESCKARVETPAGPALTWKNPSPIKKEVHRTKEELCEGTLRWRRKLPHA